MKKYRKTSDGKKGGLFVGKSHDKGGIPAIVVDTGQPIEVEGGEAIINKEATKKFWKELSEINQSAGDGNPIPPPQGFSDDVSKYNNGGKISKLALAEGTKHELEHTDTIAKFKKQGVSEKEIARQIALDHLKENPNYYKILRKIKLSKGGEIVCRKCSWSWLEKDGGNDMYVCHKCGFDNENFYKKGGAVENQKEVYDEWKSLVNMSSSELKSFLKTEDGKEAGLSKSEASELGIGSGHESASWILKMKEVPYTQWSSEMWSWAKRQISFIKRMSGNKGDLYDDKGNKTRKHTSLLIWGHNPEKFNGGGITDSEDLIIGEIYSGKKVRNIVSKYSSQEGTDMKEFAENEIKLKDKYILDYVPISNLIKIDVNLHTYISEEYDPSNDVEYREVETPILLGNDPFNNEENYVRDGYHRILQKLYNNEDSILAFIQLGSKIDIRYDSGGLTDSDNFNFVVVIKNIKNPQDTIRGTKQMYLGGYKKIFEILNEDSIFTEWGTDEEKLVGNDLFLYFSKKPDQDKIEKIEKIQNVQVLSKYKNGGRTIAQTPAPKKERIFGSKTNPPKSSESSKSAEKIVLSEQTLESIETILRDHNKTSNKKVDLNTAKAVVRRGMGAYSSSHRPTISGGKPNSRVAWGLARLKAFLYKIENEKSKSGKYSQDNDLIEDLGYEYEKYAKGNKIPKENKGGDCYEIAGKIAMGIWSVEMFADKETSYPDFIGTPYVVHAEVSGQGAISGLRYGHAWVEDDMFIYDYSNGRKIIFPKELYYAIGNVVTKKPKYFKYTFDEARKKMAETGHYGSWELITESGL